MENVAILSFAILSILALVKTMRKEKTYNTRPARVYLNMRASGTTYSKANTVYIPGNRK